MKLFAFSDFAVPSGFGRIANEVFTRLKYRGHEVFAASLLYDGALPHRLPFHVAGLSIVNASGQLWNYLYNLVNAVQPDCVFCIQDFPYAQNLYQNCRIDWSKRAMVTITPIDGEPINKNWLRVVDEVDGTMVISRFGVEAMRRAGRKVELCHPGVDTKEFKPLTPQQRIELRARAGIPNDTFIVGMAAMNQGRKAIPHTLVGFKEFAVDKPNARLLLDMDKASGVGWDLILLSEDIGLDPAKIIFREDLVKRGITEYADRLRLMDCHFVLSHREGFGLPLLESMACGIPTGAQDWCSGTELCGDGKGFLVDRFTAKQPRYSTWGNAADHDPDVNHFVQHLQWIYDNPEQARGIAETGRQWAWKQTWDVTTDQVESLLLKIMEKRQNGKSINRPPSLQPTPVFAQPAQVNAGLPATEPNGNHPDGRLLTPVRPDPVTVAPEPNDNHKESPQPV